MTSPLVTFANDFGDELLLEIDHGHNVTIFIWDKDQTAAFELSPVNALHLADLIQRNVRF